MQGSRPFPRWFILKYAKMTIAYIHLKDHAEKVSHTSNQKVKINQPPTILRPFLRHQNENAIILAVPVIMIRITNTTIGG